MTQLAFQQFLALHNYKPAQFIADYNRLAELVGAIPTTQQILTIWRRVANRKPPESVAGIPFDRFIHLAHEYSGRELPAAVVVVALPVTAELLAEVKTFAEEAGIEPEEWIRREIVAGFGNLRRVDPISWRGIEEIAKTPQDLERFRAEWPTKPQPE